jgi:hypothetical protein
LPDDVIPSTKDRPGSYDAIETAKPGEPLFPLQGGDPFAPATVLFWVDQARKAGMAEPHQRKAEALLRKASDAEQIAWAMMDYQRGEQAPPPDRGRAYYSGHTIELSAEADQARRAREALIKGADRLHNCVAEGTAIIELLAELRLHPEEEVRLREAMASIKEVAFKIEPRRGQERS